MLHAFTRTEMLIGPESLQKLRRSKVAVFGIGGVGTFAVEALARCGIGSLVLVDYDSVELTNINRQLHATFDTIGKPKVDLMRDRILTINPEAKLTALRSLYSAENADELLSDDLDYVVDAIDTITAKIDLAVRCTQRGIPIISSMGAGNKLDPTAFRVGDIYETSVDPIAKVMRKELKKRGVTGLKVAYSTEAPIKPRVPEYMKAGDKEEDNYPEQPRLRKRAVPGSIAFVPSVAGLILAGEVVKDLIGWKKD